MENDIQKPIISGMENKNKEMNVPGKTLSSGQYTACVVIITVVTAIILAVILFFLSMRSMAYSMSNGTSNFSILELMLYYIPVLAISYALLKFTRKKYYPQTAELKRTNSIIIMILLIIGLLTFLADAAFVITRINNNI